MGIGIGVMMVGGIRIGLVGGEGGGGGKEDGLGVGINETEKQEGLVLRSWPLEHFGWLFHCSLWFIAGRYGCVYNHTIFDMRRHLRP